MDQKTNQRTPVSQVDAGPPVLRTLPKIEGIIETALYADDLDKMEHFYSQVMNLTRIDRESGRHVFFDAGPSSVLLIFNPATTQQGHHLPGHGAIGAGHVAFGITPEAMPVWRDRLGELGIPLEKEITWPRGGRSIYFRDPAGNSIELITPGVWGTSHGW